MRKMVLIFLCLLAQPVWAGSVHFSRPENGEAQPAGRASSERRSGAKAFSAPLAGLSAEREVDFKLGNAIFRQQWQAGAPDAGVFSGLGPLYNARSCVQCHINDGRGIAPDGPEDGAGSLLLKLDGHDPNYGGQLQDFAVAGAVPEYRLQVTYQPVERYFADGGLITLRQPVYELTALSKGPLRKDTQFSPRLAPPMIGLGLLEAIAAADILAAADPDDRDGNGISGRANQVMAVEQGKPMLGRFGWKAGSPTIRQQVAAALANDMGVSNGIFANSGEVAEISRFNFDFLAGYAGLLGVPVRENVADPQVLRGKQVFYETGCAACHQPRFRTQTDKDHPETSDLLIWPYSDLLLHDMGAGLADGFREGLATGYEWRTPPLWGIGQVAEASGTATYLHDGRARSLIEAVLWHGGEAQNAQKRVLEISANDRAAMVVFLESL